MPIPSTLLTESNFSGMGSGYPSANPMGWGQGAMQQYPGASYPAASYPAASYPAASYPSYGHSGASTSAFPGQGSYFGPLAQMAGMSPTGPYSGYSPLTMIGR